ncbi:PKD domain-containing protein [Lewinella sp. LCG006]|uniref:PKD domain-containing protein n=1 Tax=Lewinella sp. LCG006 TaxID=3231911 RepID=UPI0034612886
MTKYFYFALVMLLSTCISAQFYDNHWMMGYLGGTQSEPNDSFGISILSFYDADLKVENNQEIDLFIQDGTALSDYFGNLLLYSNNLEIRNAEDEVIINGTFPDNSDPETILPQSFVYLPFNSLNILYYVYMSYTDDFPRLGGSVSSAIVSNLDNQIGIYEQIQNMVGDSLTTGELTACKHANGRDWWVLVPAADKPFIYSVLLSPNGVDLIDTTEVSNVMNNGLGQAVFSPNGNHYVRFNLVTINEFDYLDIFDFNRCTGEIFNHRQTNVGTDAGAGGVAISPSSQYLYLSHYNHIYQYDLWSDDVFATKDTVATYDGYTEWNFFHGRFFMAQLAPDGKIYLNSASGIKKLHVIENPDGQGLSCNVQQHAIPLPNANAFTLANHPNYRLGPIDGSPCDTLGIDNLPRAYYRIDRNPEDTLDFHFQDLSFYEPDTWAWTFGDGGMSTDRHPDHTYASPGIYEVCLTVSNDLGSDTDCRILELGPVAVDDPQALTFTTFPNPVQDVLVFDLGDYYPLNGQFRLYNAAGQLVLSQQVLYSQARMQLALLPAGIYFYEFWDGGVKLGQGKVVKV